jgi:lipid-A-disaccharide synthase
VSAAAGLADLDVFLVAGESSGDALGASLMRALGALTAGAVSFRGAGGSRMADAGLAGIFSVQDLSTIGVAAVVAKLPLILRRLRETIEAVTAAPPDVLILIDSADFSHQVAKGVRRRLPNLPIVRYVSPTVWVWRPWRARAMRRSVDLVLAILPFEPEVHRRLGGPPCVYVGHPLLENLEELRPSADEAAAREAERLVLVLPGSRRQELRRLAPVFGDALGRIAAGRAPFEVVLPTLPYLADDIARATADWPVRPRIVVGEADKHAAFRRARAALAASGTVTLELGLAGIPQVVAYRVPMIEGLIARMAIMVDSVVLTNLILGEKAVPEFLQTHCTADRIAPALADIIDDTPARLRQIDALRRLDAILHLDEKPSERAARAVLEVLGRR